MEPCQPRGAQTALLHFGGKAEDLEMLAGGSGPGRWYLTTALLKRSTALLETFPGPVEASGSPVTSVAEIKPSSGFSSLPCPRGCRALCFRVQQCWFWKDCSQFLSRPMPVQPYFRKLMLAALWVPHVNPDTEKAS